MNKSIRTLFIIPLLILIVTLAAVIIGVSYYNGQRAVNNIGTQLHQEISARIEQHIYHFLKAPHFINQLNTKLDIEDFEHLARQFLHQVTISKVPYVFYGNEQGHFIGVQRRPNQTVLKIRDAKTAPLRYIYEINDRGQIIQQDEEQTSEYDPRIRPWYQKAKQVADATWSDIYISAHRQVLQITSVMPIYDEIGKLQGVLGANFILSEISNFLKKMKIAQTGQAFIMDHDGRLIAASMDTPLSTNGPKPRPLLAIDSRNSTIQSVAQYISQHQNIASFSTQQRQFIFESGQQTTELSLYQDGRGIHWIIAVMIPDADLISDIKNNTFWSLIVSSLAVLVAIIVGILVARQVTHPILQLNQHVKELSASNWKKWMLTTDIQRFDEIGELAASFSFMAKKQVELLGSLEYRSLHDTLTGLPNRALLSKRLKKAIQAAPPNQPEALALLMLDLNGFKEVNDTLGHGVGDLLLRQIAQRLPALVRANDTFARLGGDEFAVVLPNTNLIQAQQMTEQLLEALTEPFEIEGQLLRVSASIGIVTYPEHGSDNDTLLQHADVAMYIAKNRQLGFFVYDSAEDSHSLKRLTLMTELRQAIEQHSELVLYYQPQLNLHNNRVQSLEALLRWEHPKYGLLAPDVFIPAAEQTGLMGPLTKTVVDMALRQCLSWQQKGIDVTIAVNLSVNNLQDSGLPNWIEQQLTELNLSPQKLRLEMTETVMMSDTLQAKKVIADLERLGIQIAIDDFGTGYSSLVYLRQLPLSEIKIDKSFVMTLCQNNNDTVIVQSIIGLAHNLGFKVVAEGVEDQCTQDKLKQLNCDLIQGYFLSKPQPAEQLTEWLQARV
jgi:diguanylate cyclase (GGDEF)-like protein